MAQTSYRANLSSAVFPLCLSKAGRTVIVPGADQNYDRRVDPAGEQKDAGIPQVIYLENVLPTPNGYQSVGFKPTFSGNATIPGGATVRQTLEVTAPFSSTSLLTYFIVFYSDGTVQARSNLLGWGAVVTPMGFTAPTANEKISWALVRGICYIARANKIYTFDGVNLTDISGTITGLTVGSIEWITGSFNYLIVAKADRVYWSSTTTATDFVPSLASGAGSEELGANGSWVSFLRPHPNGFAIYTSNNVIFANYTGNRSYPWKFREIADSGGYTSTYQVSSPSTNSPLQIGMTNSGQVQILSSDSAEIVTPELSDYFEKNTMYDVFDSNTNTFSQARAANLSQFQFRFETRISFIDDRYAFISYANTQATTVMAVYQYAIVYDYLLKRFGRIKFDHTHIFEFPQNGEIIFFNALTGQLKKLYFDILDQDLDNATVENRYQHNGVLVLGKLQLQRSEFITLEEIAVESSQTAALATDQVKQFELLVLPSLKGKQFDPAVTPTHRTDESEVNLEVYNCHITAKNVSLLIKGTFDLNTIQVELFSGGDW